MDKETLASLISDALGQNMLPTALCEKYELDEDDLLEILMDNDVEACAACGWVVECFDMNSCRGENFCESCCAESEDCGRECKKDLDE